MRAHLPLRVDGRLLPGARRRVLRRRPAGPPDPLRPRRIELTGLDDERVIGRPAAEVLGLTFEDGTDHVAQALEWGVRVQGKPVRVHAEGDFPVEATADLFPAYDDDGGLLIVLTPVKAAKAS